MVDDRVKQFIRDQMAEKDVSVNSLALLMDESQSTMNRQINGGVAISFQRVYHICKALKIDMHDMIDALEPSKKKAAR